MSTTISITSLSLIPAASLPLLYREIYEKRNLARGVIIINLFFSGYF